MDEWCAAGEITGGNPESLGRFSDDIAPAVLWHRGEPVVIMVPEKE